MFDVSGRATAIRLSTLAGAAALTLGGLSAAQALPMPAAPAFDAGLERVQYGPDGMRPHHGDRHHLGYGHHRYGENAHPRHPGHAGLYDCGPGGKPTRLSRKACGGNHRFQHLDGY